MGNVMGSALGKGRFETLKNAPLWGKNEAGQLAARTPAGKIDWTERAKAVGAKAVPFAGAFAASDLSGAPFGQSMLFGKKEKPAYAYPQTYGPALGMQPQQFAYGGGSPAPY